MSGAPIGSREPTAGILAPPPVIYAVPLAAGLLLQRWRPIPFVPGGAEIPLGIACVLLGLVGLPALLAFRKAKTSVNPWRPSKAVVTTGPYRLSRNPMYVGLTWFYVGIAVWVNAAWPFFFLPLVLIAMHYGVILREEAYLERTFGEEYRQYRQRVRRWL
jgi:protein-S-isoprenylcysteine O-methyltransferase Ste14